MMTKLILNWILSYRVGQLRYLVASTYLETISHVYRSAQLVFGIMFVIAFATSGILLMTFGIALIVPLSTEGRGIVLLSLGFIVLLLSFLAYRRLNSERMWIKQLNVESSLKAIAGETA